MIDRGELSAPLALVLNPNQRQRRRNSRYWGAVGLKQAQRRIMSCYYPPNGPVNAYRGQTA